jgi:hypothetical protein
VRAEICTKEIEEIDPTRFPYQRVCPAPLAARLEAGALMYWGVSDDWLSGWGGGFLWESCNSDFNNMFIFNYKLYPLYL